jgi:hypothetical protein
LFFLGNYIFIVTDYLLGERGFDSRYGNGLFSWPPTTAGSYGILFYLRGAVGMVLRHRGTLRFLDQPFEKLDSKLVVA